MCLSWVRFGRPTSPDCCDAGPPTASPDRAAVDLLEDLVVSGILAADPLHATVGVGEVSARRPVVVLGLVSGQVGVVPEEGKVRSQRAGETGENCPPPMSFAFVSSPRKPTRAASLFLRPAT